jgi:hypothetical protein
VLKGPIQVALGLRLRAGQAGRQCFGVDETRRKGPSREEKMLKRRLWESERMMKIGGARERLFGSL